MRNRLIVLCLGLLLALPLAAYGGTDEGLSFSVGCEGFTSNGGFIRLTRDNTGDNREAFSISAVDGAGNVVFQPRVDTFLVGGRVSFGEGEFYPWGVSPSANPITLTIASTQGNNLPRQVIYTMAGACAGLSSADTPGILAAGDVSPSVRPGQSPPVLSSNAAAIEQLPGYAIVNTNALNIRSGDAPEYTVVGVLRGGTRAAVVGRNQDFSWWLLNMGGVRGWANAEFLFLRGDLTDVPIVEATGELTQPTIVTFLPQQVYRAPSNLNSNIICTVPPGEYRVLGRNPGSEYYGIQAVCEDGSPVRGWLLAENGAIRNPAGIVIPVAE